MLNRRKEKTDWWLLPLAVVLLILLLVTMADYFLLTRYYVVEVVGSSMENTLQDGDLLYAEREFSVRRGDVVIVDVSENPAFSNGEEHNIIKRVIAVGGDRVKCEDGQVYLAEGGGEYRLLPEPYVYGENTLSFEYSIAEGEIFVMGDHRTVSMDSRRVGPLEEADVIGVVPGWAIRNKELIGAWENVRVLLTAWMH